jgi:hypothetical protein
MGLPMASAGCQHAFIHVLLWPGVLTGNLQPLHMMPAAWVVEARQHVEDLACAVAVLGG